MEIYVGGFPWESTGEELENLFKPYGEVARVNMIFDRETKRPRGFAFVEMPDEAEARAAMTGLNGATLGDRLLRVNQSIRSRGPRTVGHENFKQQI